MTRLEDVQQFFAKKDVQIALMHNALHISCTIIIMGKSSQNSGMMPRDHKATVAATA